MNVICIDDERILMEDTVSMCREMPEIADVNGFTKAADALDWLNSNPVDLALLDIDMPDMNGLELAIRIKDRSPDAAVIFLTGYAQYAVDAFMLHASGYLLKPVSKEQLAAEIRYVFSLKRKTLSADKRVSVRTFGGFEVYVDDRQIKFHMAKCKELLAYLVDRQGCSVTRPELSAILWEDRIYDRRQQKRLDVYIRSLRDTLAEYGIERILEMRRGTLRVVPEEFDCDAYRFFAGDPDAVNAYRGEYMSAYSWASITEGVMFWQQSAKNTTES